MTATYLYHVGWMPEATEDTTSSGSGTASGNYKFAEVNANEKVYLLGEILASPNLRIFTFLELKAATRNFKIDTLLGEGAYWRTYRGSLHEKSMSESGSEALIAVKRVSSESIPKFQECWQSELDLHGRLSHPNIVKLIGYCWENKELLLVYEFMQEGSLENHLFGRRGSVLNPLTWERRIKILLGAARGLAFLHESQSRGLIRNEKRSEGFYDKFMPSDVLLDHSCSAKLSDFGVRKVDPYIYGEAHPFVLSGATCRFAPEYIIAGKLCLKTDVFGFGILLVEMITGLRALDTHRPSGQEVLLNWIRPHLSHRKKLLRILDSKLERNYPVKAVTEVSQLALLCLEYDPEYRPSMEEVVKVLELIESANKKNKRNWMNSASQIAYLHGHQL